MTPSGLGTHRVAGVVWVLTMVLTVVGTVSGFLAGPAPEGINLTPGPVVAFFALTFAAYATVGVIVVSHADGHPVGWLFLAAGALYAAGNAANHLAKMRFLDGHADDLSAWLSWVTVWSWEVAVALLLVALVLFPHRRPTSRLAAGLIVVLGVNTVVQAVSLAVLPGELDGGSHQDNPIGLDGRYDTVKRVVDGSESFSTVLAYVVFALVLVSYVQATAGERRKLRWVTAAVVAFLVTSLVSLVGAVVWDVDIQVIPFFTQLLLVPTAMAVAILRDHLFDIELIVNRLVVYVVLIAGITAVYVAVALGFRAVFVGGQASTVAAAVALVVISLGLAPAREWAQRLADRVVFGRRATPYHAVGSFAEHTAGAGSLRDTAPRLAALLADATGAQSAVVFVRAGDELIPVARESSKTTEVASVPIAELTGTLDGFAVVERVERRGELLGAVAVQMPPGRAIRPAERRVVRELAAQAALSFETLRLTAELTSHADRLAAQAVELRDSRRRLVEVQDAERQRIGRDLHDGAQQHLVAILTKAGMARSQLARDPALADATILELQHDTRDALGEIRDVVHGIFPQILADRGLVVAVQQRAARLPIPVVVEADPADVGRHFPPSVEATAWFVVSEALTNVLKHAHATQVTVRVVSGAELTIEVADDGVGRQGSVNGHGLTNMADRVAAVGGYLSVDDHEGGGCVVRGSFPLTPEPEP